MLSRRERVNQLGHSIIPRALAGVYLDSNCNHIGLYGIIIGRCLIQFAIGTMSLDCLVTEHKKSLSMQTLNIDQEHGQL